MSNRIANVSCVEHADSVFPSNRVYLVPTGCMDSLVYYKRLLMQKDPEADKNTLIEDCLRLLQELRTVDPARKQRYLDIGSSWSISSYKLLIVITIF